MSSSVTMKALQRGWEVFSQTPGFFSTAAESWPVMGMVLVCRALAMAESRVSSVQPGPTPARGREIHNQALPQAASRKSGQWELNFNGKAQAVSLKTHMT